MLIFTVGVPVADLEVLLHHSLPLVLGKLVPLVSLDEGIYEEVVSPDSPHACARALLVRVPVLVNVGRPAGHGQVGVGYVQVLAQVGAVELEGQSVQEFKGGAYLP